MTKISTESDFSRIHQGDIIRNVEFIEHATTQDGQFEISLIIFPYVYVLTQDCDLEQEYKNRSNQQGKQDDKQDKYLISIIVAPIYNYDQFVIGNHLSELKLKMQTLSSNQKKLVEQNNNSRYHYLRFEAIEELDIPDSVIDFKHYFSINSQRLLRIKEQCHLCKVSELYREQISHRFSHYLSRIGLPENQTD